MGEQVRNDGDRRRSKQSDRPSFLGGPFSNRLSQKVNSSDASRGISPGRDQRPEETPREHLTVYGLGLVRCAAVGDK